LIDDPMRGYLANLDPDDYKKFFRSYLLDAEIQGAADHHVLEARRVKQFCEFIEQAASLDLADTHRYILMDKVGHLMYASHLSYMNDARLGSDECDLLVKLVREREKSSLYGARMTGRGCGGTVAVLCEENDPAQRAIGEICRDYSQLMMRTAQLVRAPGVAANR
jgi:galactokinase